MRHFSSALWPIHYKPLPDELLSCWLVRLAHGHGLKVQTFCNIIFGSGLQVWNRDIDRLAPKWLLDELTTRTGASATTVLNTTLRFYETKLYEKFRSAGVLNWILLLQMYHRKRKGFGLQFCPTCLAEDQTPYFRKIWRVALCTTCIRHNTMLHDRCSNCQAAVAIHRIDMQESNSAETDLLCWCYHCGCDLRNAPVVDPIVYRPSTQIILGNAARQLTMPCEDADKWPLASYSVMRQLCRLMTTRYEHARLRSFILCELGLPDVPLAGGHISFEMRPIEERHHLLQLAAWLLEDLEGRIAAAWLSGAIRYNLLLKDFENPPDYYVKIVKKLNNWRDRIT